MIERGGKNEERLYLHDCDFLYKGEPVKIRKTDMPDMVNIIHRHTARYYLPAFFLRPGMKVLDIPCGSGYGYPILSKNVVYTGVDKDIITIEYCRRIYANSVKIFYDGDITSINFLPKSFDVIACIDGIEHVEKEYHENILKMVNSVLKDDGKLIITTPEAQEKPEQENPYHKGEMTRKEFTTLLRKFFTSYDLIIQKDKLHNGNEANLMFAICYKKGGGR